MGIGFSSWIRWDVRNSIPNIGKPGVYLIGRFTQAPPSGPANPLEINVVYIGESTDGRFRYRWRSFDRAAFKGKKAHRGGVEYQQKFGGDSSVLYVSILPEDEIAEGLLGIEKCSFIDNITDIVEVNNAVELNVLLGGIDDLLIKYLERRLILLYSITHGNRPACNTD